MAEELIKQTLLFCFKTPRFLFPVVLTFSATQINKGSFRTSLVVNKNGCIWRCDLTNLYGVCPSGPVTNTRLKSVCNVCNYITL